MRTIQLQCIIFRENKGSYEFLLLKRILEKGGFWQPSCGGLEKNDKSKLDACYREILEETGIKKEDIIRVIEEVYSYTYGKHYLTGESIPPITEYVYAFEVGMEIEVKIENNIHNEHEKYDWISYDKAIELLKWKDNKKAFKKLNSILVS